MNDLRFALRQLLKSPGFTLVAVLTLALGIGVNTSMFSALQATLMRQLPYPDADRLVRVFRTAPQSQSWPHSTANFLDHRAQNQVLEGMAALSWKPFNLAEPGQPAERLRGMLTSAELFPLLGIAPALGRTFTADEDRPGRNQVVILNHGFWLRRFAGDPKILGRTLRLDGETVTVIGVMPARFHDPMLWGPIDVWRPLAFTDDQRQDRDHNWLQVVGRYKPGISFAQARAGMEALGERLARDYPPSNARTGLRLLPLAESGMDDTGRKVVWLTTGLTAFVLLIACANLANLQFARTALRRRELAIRGALGAPRGRLLRQLLTESLLISFLGGGCGLIFAIWGNEWVGRQIIVGDDTGMVLPLNLKVLGFALLLSTLTGLAFGLFPASLAVRRDVNESLKQGSRGTTDDRSQHRMRHGLIVAEVAAALVLLAGAGLFIRGLDRFTFRDPGWQVDGLTIGHVSLPESKYAGEGAQLAFAERLKEKLATMPGVQRAALAREIPIWDFNSSFTFAVEGLPVPPRGQEPLRAFNAVTPGYFDTLRMHRLTGRDFNTGDTPGSPRVVVISQALANAYWPGESPLGKRIGGPDAWEEIVGVVSDVRFPANLRDPDTRFQTYRPLAQAPQGYLALAVRGNVTAENLRQAVAELDSDLPVNEPGTARVATDRYLANYALIGRLLGGFAALGLLLAGLGIYGVIAGFVVQRTGEIGVRIALGAQVRDVLWLVLGKGLRLAILGAAIGLVGAFGVARLLSAAAPELGSYDPLALTTVAGLLVLVASMACWLPARRAARMDPVVALRGE